MIIICKASEKIAMLCKLSPENGTCIDCPVFDMCNTYETCETALENGIKWVIDEG